jgi:putative ABC transport system permease protein
MTLLHDLRFAARVLAKKPLFTLVAVVTLALGIGAGSSMFGITRTIVLRPLDFPGLDGLAAIQMRHGQYDFDINVAPRAFLDYRADSRSFEELAAYQWWNVAVTGDGDPEQVLAFQVSPRFFDLIGVRPELGRWFASDEVDGQNEHVAILSHALWDRRYGRDPAILGKSVTIDRESYTVVGVMPHDFRFPYAAEMWAPLTLTPEQRADRKSDFLGTVGRLRSGVTVAEADAEMRQMGERHAATYREAANQQLRVVSLSRAVVEDYTRDFIYTLGGAALFLLLLVCANVANLFLAHALTRRRELAVRAALGAGRGRIVRQLVTEAGLLGLAGGVASLLVASWTIDVIHGMIPPSIARYVPGWDNLGVDGSVLAFAIAAGVLVGIVVGVMPALQVARTDVNSVLKDGDRGTTGGRRHHRLRAALVVAQVMLALVLLLAGGALSRGFARLADPTRAVDPNGILTFRVTLPEAREERPEAARDLEQRVLERLAALPGVDAFGAANNLPWGQHGAGRTVEPEGRPAPRPGDDIDVDYRSASPGYLETIRVPRLEGRTLAATDGRDAQRVAVVSATAARRMWPGEPALGKRFRWGMDAKSPWLTVVGVVGDVNDRNISTTPRAAVYVPSAQEPHGGMSYALRTAGEPMALARAARAAVYAAEPTQPVDEVMTLDAVRAERFSGLRAGTSIMAAFALLALFLAAIGIYAVIATLVTQRTHEIGVRMALGAQRRDIVTLVLRKGAVLTGVGLVLGVVLGVLLVRLMAGMLAGVVDTSSAVTVAVTVGVALVALAGSSVPAWRATRVDPLVVLRDE